MCGLGSGKDLCLRDSLCAGAREVLPLPSPKLAATSGVLWDWFGARGSAWSAAEKLCGHLLPTPIPAPDVSFHLVPVSFVQPPEFLGLCLLDVSPSSVLESRTRERSLFPWQVHCPCDVLRAGVAGASERPSAARGRHQGLHCQPCHPLRPQRRQPAHLLQHACPERCPRVHLLVPGIHGAGSDRQPCRAGGFPEGILGPPREPTTAAVPRGGGHQRQGRAAPLQVRFLQLGGWEWLCCLVTKWLRVALGSFTAEFLPSSSWPFSILDEVQPVALQVRRPLVAVSVADSSWITELLWTFFVPFTVYQVRWMPSVPRQADERSEDFALRVQELLAMELGVVSTRITAADRTEHMKRLRHTARLPFAPALSQRPAARPRVPPTLPGGAPEDVRVVAMAQQVKEVLPHVPLEVIKTDLVQTNCVDTTIANLLEGRVPFFPESKEAEDLPAPSTSQAAAASGIQGSVAAPSSKPATKQFAKSPVERHLSLQERKRALYDYARRRFAEKHGAARAGGSP
uniref:Lipid droplet-regulating VLDL assembly factor AUP1 n=1 Tax=Taeniopygia guttata TaxID=59729 RepID=A0A674GPN8_TAEGU